MQIICLGSKQETTASKSQKKTTIQINETDAILQDPSDIMRSFSRNVQNPLFKIEGQNTPSLSSDDDDDPNNIYSSLI